MLWLGQCARARTFLLIRKAITCLLCERHTGATRGHNHVMNVLAQLACNTGYSVRVHHKVSTTAAASNKQGDVELVNFGLDNYSSLVIDVLICCDHVGNSTINNGHLNSKMHTIDYLQARATIKTIGSKRIMQLSVRRLPLQLCQWLAKFIPSFFVSYGSCDKQTRNYYALISAEEEIGSKAFT